MTGHVKVGGAWKSVASVNAKVDGAWKAVDSGFTKVSGDWKQFYSAEAPSSYELIESAILTSDESSVTFSSIPQDFKHLQIRAVVRGDAAFVGGNSQVRFNGDSGSNYSYHTLTSNGSAGTVFSTAATSESSIRLLDSAEANETANAFRVSVADFIDYASTSKNTTVKSLEGGGNNSRLRSGLWMNTAAVTQITIGRPFGGNFVTGSRFSLYGIRGE